MNVPRWLLVAAIVLFVMVLRKRHEATDDAAAVVTQPHPFDFSATPGNPVNDQIVDAISRMGATGEDAEYEYQTKVDRLRAVAAEAITIIEAAYKNAPEQRYADRWSLIQLLTDLRHPSTIPVLDSVISARIPPERSKQPHSFTTVGEEVIIRTTAVEGMARLAADGDQNALDILRKHSRHENFSVKRASIQGYLGSRREKGREELLAILPASDHFILDIRPADIRRIEQAEPRRTLKVKEEEDVPRGGAVKPHREG